MASYHIVQETFDTLASGWEALLSQAHNNTVFATPTWLRLWWDELSHDHELLLFGIQEERQLAAVVPLKRKDGQVSFIGSPNVCDYMDFIVRDGLDRGVYEVLADHLSALEWDTLRLNGITADSPTMAYLPDLLKERGITSAVRPEEVCPKIDLPSTWDEYLGLLSKKNRHELRRKMRRLYSAGNVRYHVASGRDGYPKDLEEFLSLLINSRADKALFMTQEIKDFFQSVVPGMAEQGIARLSFLELDGKRVSSAICFDYNDSYYLYNSGYDTEYASLSVGLLLKVFCLKEAIEAGRKQFNFLRGSEAYKYRLGAVDEVVYTISATR
ncbi:MAG: GNAT family N-acetyltransferase [Dehalococcoidia bacterium]